MWVEVSLLSDNLPSSLTHWVTAQTLLFFGRIFREGKLILWPLFLPLISNLGLMSLRQAPGMPSAHSRGSAHHTTEEMASFSFFSTGI